MIYRYHFALCLLHFFLFTKSSIAQTEQQSIQLGGNINVSYNQQDSIHVTSFTLAPTFGYFAIRNFMLGASIGIGTTSDNKAKGGKNRFIINTSFVPFAYYYFLKDKLRPFLFVKFGYINSTSLISGNSANIDGITGGGGIGLNYFFSKNVGLETAVGYSAIQLQKQKLSSTIALGIGLHFYFHPRIKNIPTT